jgi:hypothetical protein
MDVVLFANIYRCGMDIVRFEIGRCENLNLEEIECLTVCLLKS